MKLTSLVFNGLWRVSTSRSMLGLLPQLLCPADPREPHHHHVSGLLSQKAPVPLLHVGVPFFSCTKLSWDQLIRGIDLRSSAQLSALGRFTAESTKGRGKTFRNFYCTLGNVMTLPFHILEPVSVLFTLSHFLS